MNHFQDLDHYIALGCLHFNNALPKTCGPTLEDKWTEILDLPDEIRLIIGSEAAKLSDANWIRLFSRCSSPVTQSPCNVVRVYLLPEDWNRRYIDRTSKSLKSALRQLLSQIDISPNVWYGDHRESEITNYDPWASVENVSLYYLFNKLPSPKPDPRNIKNRYTRIAVRDLLKSAAFSEWEQHGEQPLAGLKTRLYPYQARSASLMIERETAPKLQLDPRLEVRTAPDGKSFFFGARDGSFLQEPRYYEAKRGGILAETMGLGKTIICLAVILTTKGHYPLIPDTYLPSLPVRARVGSLSDMAASIIGRHSIPAKAFIEQSELNNGTDYTFHKDALDRNMPFYEIPSELPRLTRKTVISPPRQLVTCSATIIVVPRNLLHQWQSEIKKHVLPGGLQVLVVDSVSKRGNSSKTKQIPQDSDTAKLVSELPTPTELMNYDIILFTRNRFEQEFQDGADEFGRRAAAGVNRVCNCPYIGSTNVPDCSCFGGGNVYESPLKKLHWLRIIIDEGHSFSSAMSKAVLVAKQIVVERRWVVSGTPAKNLVGVELDMLSLDTDNKDATALRELAIQQRKTFNREDVDGAKATKALGLLVSHFLMVRPWCDSTTEGRLDWEEYVYRHEHQYNKTWSGFSSCFVRTLQDLVVKTRPEDVEKDIMLPPMRHRVVYLKPCWYDKMTANLFIQVLRANAITSERSDVDYLFHKNSVKARHSLIRNLRQSNFTWTGFRLEDVISTIEVTETYLSKHDKNCSPVDASSLLESSRAISKLARSEEWIALSKAHEVGMAIEDWPAESEELFSLVYPAKPAMIGITQLLEGQLHIDSNILSQDPAEGLQKVGQTAIEKLDAILQAKNKTEETRERFANERKVGVPSSCVGDQQISKSRRAVIMANKASSPNVPRVESAEPTLDSAVSTVRRRKRKLTLAEEQAELGAESALRRTRIIGCTSAKLSYLIDKVMQHQATDKIIIFYDGDNAAFYIAQCLEMLYINHRIYARTLENTKRSEYIALFNEDPDIRVLLIDVACGALGLNLNVASVVLIVNPINRPGIEAQAIKRAHRIGQTKPVLVETLVLENTIEHAIFDRAKKMSRAQHSEAKELEDDAGIIEIIQKAQILPILSEEDQWEGRFARLVRPQPIFGRPNRHKYHRFGTTGAKISDIPRKKAKTNKQVTKKSSSGLDMTHQMDNGASADEASVVESLTFTARRQGSQAENSSINTGSLFGDGTDIVSR
ncbi:P-loop containing nucleoside triphosphate hydrolase protein [Phaeosphaeriaceae sp. PMI808]|nr:P-loop containing nucleoside triphosphate hydrolase protein [Phaeosphaeriaceae sp. PMI808]